MSTYYRFECFDHEVTGPRFDRQAGGLAFDKDSVHKFLTDHESFCDLRLTSESSFSELFEVSKGSK